MTQSAELLFDTDTDAAVRADWAALSEAGLPSQGRNAAETNRPHATLWAGERMRESAEASLGRLRPVMPIPLRLGAIACFGRRRFILVRFVVTSVRLLEFQASVAETCGVERGSNLAPGSWTPHVTLARRLTATQVGAALDALDGVGERDAYAVGWRRWDGDARREWPLPCDLLE